MTAAINTKPPIGLLRFVRRSKDAEDIPIGSIVRTPLGQLATVKAYRGNTRSGAGYKGAKRGHRQWLVCEYLSPPNRAFNVVLVLPELVEVVNRG